MTFKTLPMIQPSVPCLNRPVCTTSRGPLLSECRTWGTRPSLYFLPESSVLWAIKISRQYLPSLSPHPSSWPRVMAEFTGRQPIPAPHSLLPTCATQNPCLWRPLSSCLRLQTWWPGEGSIRTPLFSAVAPGHPNAVFMALNHLSLHLPSSGLTPRLPIRSEFLFYILAAPSLPVLTTYSNLSLCNPSFSQFPSSR